MPSAVEQRSDTMTERMSELSPLLPPFTLGVMTVNCQVGAQEEEFSWLYSQVATAPAEAASEQQRESCSEKSDVGKASFPLQASN